MRKHFTSGVIIVLIWAAAAIVQHRMAGWTCPGTAGRTVHRGVVLAQIPSGVRVRVTSTSAHDTVEAAFSPVAGTRALETGTRVFVQMHDDGSGAVVVGVVRDTRMLYLAAAFLSLFVLVGGRNPIGSMAGLAAAFGGTLFVLVPMILAGVRPQTAAILTASGSAAVISLLVSGVRRRTLAIVAGCVGGLLATFVLAGLACSSLRLTGVYSPLTKDLWFTPAGRQIDFVGLLSAGIMLGALGVVIDLATAVAAAVFEVAEVAPGLSRLGLAGSGLRVGRDVMGTELNTLVFAYAGARVGLLLLPFFGPRGYELPLMQVLSSQEFAVEAAHIAVGTVGLILTIPLTALVAGLLAPGTRRWGAAGAIAPLQRRWGAWAGGAFCWIALGAVGLVFAGRSYHTYAPTHAGRAQMQLVRANVLAADPPAEELAARAAGERRQQVTARLLTGLATGTDLLVHNSISGLPEHDKIARPGTRLLLKTMTVGGRMVASVIDYDRLAPLVVTACCVVLLAMIVGGTSGLRATVALALCAPILGGVLYLVAATGAPALPLLTGAALLICAAVFVILAGPTPKAACAAGGAFIGIAAGGLVAAAASAWMGFTGLQQNSLFAVRMFGAAGELDFRGLLAGGMLLGVVGVAMDVAMAVASASDEIAQAGARSRAELWRRGMGVGRKVMCTMVLALLFAYLGANIPLLLLPRAVPGLPTMLAINNDRFAPEELRMIAGGIGIVVTIPATALLASIFINKTPSAANKET